MNRHILALDAADHPAELIDLAHNFVLSVEEAMTENLDPATDPAVMLLGHQIAFLVHADIGSTSMRDKLVSACLANSTTFVPNSSRH